jgi:CRP/FNR family transcriptional regulator
MASAATQSAFNNGWSVCTPHVVSNKCEFQSWASNTSLGTLSAEALRDLESIMTIADYDAGSILFLEQESLSRVYVVLDGDVRLSLQDIGGKRLTIRIAKRGAVLGMSEAFSGSLSEWSADTLYPSKIASIKRNDFIRFSERHTEVYRLATMELIRTCSNTYRTLRILGLTCCVRKKLGGQLLVWAEQGTRMDDQSRFRLAMSHAQIAEFIGTSRESVSRTLADFRRSKLIEFRGSMVIIPSMAALKEYVERR